MTAHQTTKLQTMPVDSTTVYEVETKQARYQGETLSEALRLWKSYSAHDQSEVVSVRRVG